MCHSGLKTKFNIQIPFAQSRHFELVLTFPTENRLTLRMLTSKLPLINLFVLRLSTDATSSGPIEQVINFNRTGTAGQTVTLQCTSTSSEPADWWFHNETLHQICSVGLIINSFKTDGRFQLQKAFGGDWSLVVRNVRPSDSGVYICRTIEYVVVQYNLTVLRESFFVLVYTTQPLLLLLHVLTTTTITTTTTTTTCTYHHHHHHYYYYYMYLPPPPPPPPPPPLLLLHVLTTTTTTTTTTTCTYHHHHHHHYYYYNTVSQKRTNVNKL